MEVELQLSQLLNSLSLDSQRRKVIFVSIALLRYIVVALAHKHAY